MLGVFLVGSHSRPLALPILAPSHTLFLFLSVSNLLRYNEPQQEISFW